MTKRKPPEELKKPGPKDPVWTLETATQLFEDMISWQMADADNLYWEKFIVMERGLYPSVVSYLIGKYPELSNLLKKAEKVQEIRLLEKVGKGEIKSIFVLKNKHGYADKVETKTETFTRQANTREELQGLTLDQLKDRLRELTGRNDKN